MTSRYLAYEFIKSNTPEDYWLSDNCYTIPFPSNERTYNDYLNDAGMALFKEQEEKFLNGQIKNTIVADEIIPELSGSWMEKEYHSYKHLNINSIKLMITTRHNYTIVFIDMQNGIMRYCKTSTIRMIDPELKWFYTISGSLYGINDVNKKMHHFLKDNGSY
jgi:hypothetical protein